MQHQALQSRPRGRAESERSAEATRSATRRPGRPAGVIEPLARFALALAGTSQRLKDADSFTPAGAEAMALKHTSLRRASRVRSKLSVAPVKDKHAPEKAKRRASLVEPLLVRTDVLNPYAAALARFSHAAGTTDRGRRQALKGRSTQVSRASHCVDKVARGS